MERIKDVWILVKRQLKSLLSIEDKPAKIAAGAAVGTFFGIMPGGISIALLVAAVFRLNLKAATVMVIATNSWSTILLLPAFAVVGSKLMGKNYLELFDIFSDYYAHGLRYFFSQVIFFDITLPLLVGMVVVALAIAMIVYLILFFSIRYYKKKLINYTNR